MKILPNSIIQFVLRSKKTILLIILVSAITLLISTIAAIWLSSFHNLRFQNLGTLRLIGTKAYGGDINTTQGEQTIDWGEVYLGTPITRSFYIKSESNVPITLILLDITSTSITFQNWRDEYITEASPIEKPIILTDNFSSTILQPNEEINATLTLEVSSDPTFLQYLIRNEIRKFGFEIVITPSEQQ